MTTLLTSQSDLELGCSALDSDDCSESSSLEEEVGSSNESCITEAVVTMVNNMNINSSSNNNNNTSVISRSSSSSSCVSVDLENGGRKEEVNNKKLEDKDCRICHLSLDGSNPESGLPIELGCSCKDDLAAAHRHCAEAWFKIRGNKTCEICGSTARNVVGVNEVELVEQWNESNETAATTTAPSQPSDRRHFWQGHRFLNFLLACMVFAFVISWLFHFNVPS